MAFFSFIIGCYWFYIGWRINRGVNASERLPQLNQLERSNPSNPMVSIIVAARDEAERIGETVRCLAGQQCVDFELIVVDDRSTDETANIVTEYAVKDSRIRLIQVKTLPDSWLGKCHACWQAAQQAKGDWLLFTDGDAHMTPELIARAVAKAVLEKADHMALLPAIVADRFWTRVALVGQAQLFTLYTSPETNVVPVYARQ